VLQVETLFELGGVVATLQVAWAYAPVGASHLTVDQAAALVLTAVVSGRSLVQAVRRYWQLHHQNRGDMEFPPDRLVTFLCNIISDHRTVPCL